MPETAPNNQDPLLCRLIVQQGLATAEEVRDCQAFHQELQHRRDTDNDRGLADILVANGVITHRQLDRLQARLVTESHDSPQVPTDLHIPGFQIIRQLGTGAMATVYLANQLSLDRLVALKVLPREHTHNREFVDRFYAEGRAAAKLNHNNIVGALDVSSAGDFHYFVMEYVEGHTVLDDLTLNKFYNEYEALAIVIQIARALDHAHKSGLVHRDVKPKNIILTPQGVAKLADMGLARMLTDREAAEAEVGKAFGTPYYISPEQIRGDLDIDARADIYGLGGTFYHMVTGQVPFEGPNPSAVMQKHLKANLTPPDHLNTSLSAGAGEIIEVCMAKDRRQRYATTASLLEDLEAVSRGDPPMIARRKFDLAVLVDLEQSSASPDATRTRGMHTDGPIYANPLFWIAMAGWLLAGTILLSYLWAIA